MDTFDKIKYARIGSGLLLNQILKQSNFEKLVRAMLLHGQDGFSKSYPSRDFSEQ